MRRLTKEINKSKYNQNDNEIMYAVKRIYSELLKPLKRKKISFIGWNLFDSFNLDKRFNSISISIDCY